jgi:hypothetical protein
LANIWNFDIRQKFIEIPTLIKKKEKLLTTTITKKHLANIWSFHAHKKFLEIHTLIEEKGKLPTTIIMKKAGLKYRST